MRSKIIRTHFPGPQIKWTSPIFTTTAIDNSTTRIKASIKSDLLPAVGRHMSCDGADAGFGNGVNKQAVGSGLELDAVGGIEVNPAGGTGLRRV